MYIPARAAGLLLVLLWVVPPPHAQATAIALTDGFIGMDRFSPAPFDDVRVHLNGPDFALTNSFLIDSFVFSSPRHAGAFLLAPGTLTDFSGDALLFAPSDRVVYNGVAYRASGRIGVSAAPVPVDRLVTAPFLLNGAVRGHSLTGPEIIDFELSGAGLLTASFQALAPDTYSLAGLRYDITPVPEPASALLLASGVVGLRRLLRRPRTAG